MDARRFDALLLSLFGSPSRRDALRLLAGAALGGGFVLLAGSRAETRRRRRRRKRKKRGGPRCSPACGAGMRCAAGTCVVGQGTCPEGAGNCAAGSEFVPCALQPQQVEENCLCRTSTEGQTRCADQGAIDERVVCGQCGSSAECARLYPAIPGVFCLLVTGEPGACCAPGTRGMCQAPCPMPDPCATAADCTGDLEVCERHTCVNGRCGRAFAPEGTVLPPFYQTPGNCGVRVCTGEGSRETRDDPDDDDTPEPTECITGECAGGQVVIKEPGTPCNGGAGECDTSGRCLPPEEP